MKECRCNIPHVATVPIVLIFEVIESKTSSSFKWSYKSLELNPKHINSFCLLLVNST